MIGCVLQPINLEGRECPCIVSTHTCVKATNMCVANDNFEGEPCPCPENYTCDRDLEVCKSDTAGGRPTGDGDGDGGDGDTAGSGGGDGDGDVRTGDGDGDVTPGDGDGVTGDGDGDTKPGVCVEVAPSGACPTECDNCDAGICTFVCSGGLLSCSGDTKVCPPGWPCIMDCSPIAGVVACTGSNFVCNDATCQLICSVSSCNSMTITCGTGRCQALCTASVTIDCGASCGCTGGCE